MIKIDEFLDWLHGTMERKLSRFTFGLLLSQVLYLMLHFACVRCESFVVAFLLATLAAGVREAIGVKYGVPSWKDLLASEVGIVVGLLIMLCV